MARKHFESRHATLGRCSRRTMGNAEVKETPLSEAIAGGDRHRAPSNKHRHKDREVCVAQPTTPRNLQWLELLITFDRSGHLGKVPHPRTYPIVVCNALNLSV